MNLDYDFSIITSIKVAAAAATLRKGLGEDDSGGEFLFGEELVGGFDFLLGIFLGRIVSKQGDDGVINKDGKEAEGFGFVCRFFYLPR